MDPNVKIIIETIGRFIEAISAQNVDESKSIGNIQFEKYDASVEDFDTYMERPTAYFQARNVPETKKTDLFVTLIGSKLFTLLKTLIHPNTYEGKTYKELLDVLKKHISPAPLIIPSSHTFINRKQVEGESVTDFITQLRRLVVPC